MYGYFGSPYDLGEYEGGDLDGVMDYLKKDVMGIPVWALGLGALALVYTAPGKKLLSAVGLKKNPRRRRVKHNRRRHNRRRRSR